jgi:hypothetical protein
MYAQYNPGEKRNSKLVKELVKLSNRVSLGFGKSVENASAWQNS